MNLQVYDGMTQIGYEKSHREFRYGMSHLTSPPPNPEKEK